jgi:hypothetical protein
VDRILLYLYKMLGARKKRNIGKCLIHEHLNSRSSEVDCQQLEVGQWD